MALRDCYVLLDDSLKEALNPWMDPDFLRCPIPIRRYTFSDSTDASLDAYIEVLLPHSVRSLWPLASGVGRDVNVLERAKGGALIPHQVPGPVKRSLHQNPFR